MCELMSIAESGGSHVVHLHAKKSCMRQFVIENVFSVSCCAAYASKNRDHREKFVAAC